MLEKGIGEHRIDKARYWQGLRLRTDTDYDSMTEHDAISQEFSYIEKSKKGYGETRHEMSSVMDYVDEETTDD